jgi:putative ATP-binding cassette transporter
VHTARLWVWLNIGLDGVVAYLPALLPHSGGEQQRLGFARLLYQRPAFALLDESTSAMDVALEEHCMRAALAVGITCVSVGHRPSLRAFHACCLTLDGSGGAVLTPLGDR